MILNVSGRTDIVAFYTPWFLKRYQEGFVDVRNPYNPKLVSRIYFTDVEAILFCTKNPLPMIDHLKEITQPIVFHVTLTGYKKDIEPMVPDKVSIIEGIKKLSSLLGKENVVIRYDPIFLNEKYTVDYHIRAFERICSLLDGYVEKILISFIDIYKNVEKNAQALKLIPFQEEDYRNIGVSFSQIANAHHIVVHTCFEERNLLEFGFDQGECMSTTLAYQLTGRRFTEEWKARKERKCHCVAMADIGEYNTCSHFCKYCYANFDEIIVNEKRKNHHVDSSLLIGELQPDDIIKVRKK